MEATRRSLLRNGANLQLADRAVPVRLTIALSDTDQATALTMLANSLFFPGRDEALAAVPAIYSALLPTTLDGLPPVSQGQCNCSEVGQPACKGKSARVGLQRPKLVSQVDPEFPKEARHKKYSGTVGVVFTIDAQGGTGDFWLAHVVGVGLDEAALAAVRRYRFQPGLCHDKPAAVPLEVDVNFQIF